MLLYQVTFEMRGYYQIGPCMLESGDLFGLHRRFRVASEPHFVIVYPKVIPLEGFDIASRRPIGEVRMTPSAVRRSDAHRRRAPVPAGRSLNRVHWRATARTGELHSKVYEPSCIAGATIVLDFQPRFVPAAQRADTLGAGHHRRGLAGQRRVSIGAANRLGHQRARRRRPHSAGRLGARVPHAQSGPTEARA